MNIDSQTVLDFLKSAAFQKWGVRVRFSSRAPVSMRLPKVSTSEGIFLRQISVAQSLHKKFVGTIICVTKFVVSQKVRRATQKR